MGALVSSVFAQAILLDRIAAVVNGRVITESDIFRILLEMLGARTEGVRVSLLVPEGKGILAKITACIAEIGGNILALGTMLGRDPTNREIIVRVAGVEPERLVRALETLELPGGVVNVLDVRYCVLPNSCEGGRLG